MSRKNSKFKKKKKIFLNSKNHPKILFGNRKKKIFKITDLSGYLFFPKSLILNMHCNNHFTVANILIVMMMSFIGIS